jgi:hypothetical protein
MQIRVAFEPTRLSAEHLRRAYEIVLPVVKRTMIKEGEDTAPCEDNNTQSVARRRQQRGS